MSAAPVRQAGVLAPLFALPSRRSWGIGEFGDLEPFDEWLRSAGPDVLLLLPLNEMAEGQHSPYSALSAMALDPIFISMDAVPEFAALGGEASMHPGQRVALEAARSAARINYDIVRRLKNDALVAAFEQFVRTEWRQESARADGLREYVSREAWWLDDYALFRALHAQHRGRHWTEWDPSLATRDPVALVDARITLRQQILFQQYLQWVAEEQWQAARKRTPQLTVLGDFPFVVSGDSADVWARAEEFRLDASVGTPPDAFSETGQNWGLPVYRWDVMERGGFEWLRQRARRASALYDGFRVDHLVGFYRTYVRPIAGPSQFVPAEESEQLALGERLVRLFLETGSRVIAEDLGTVPDFVRQSLARFGLPGYRVLRWEREWHQPTQPFRDPAAYPAASVATSGTHDTETLAEWWDAAPDDEKRLAGEIPMLHQFGWDFATARFDDRLRDALLETMYASGSDLLILPIQDFFGWRDRINEPATVGEENWTWRLPWPVDTLTEQPAARERAVFLSELARRHSR